ncbi:YgiT-type zinc finger protein [Thermoanaerobacterium sp. RBIITD]|uniref:YgiT-type zinc finger protein n=1 Tax=Thermoanaerobacterium sp. RBIITD TaxID=1550240 RepID=UPI000BB8537B|nr:YgiT-type zinc finger protein [Thermoanaerobacterium sp. RBIITD]SNX54889.1 YgiT-type zinc finger domain-containing protein [Thermoanaerobacterium sp. RBIITD]
MLKKCYCGGIIEIKPTDYELIKGKRVKIYKNVPTYVCQKCGAKYYDTEVLDKLLKEDNCISYRLHQTF